MARAYRVRASALVGIDPASPAAFSYDRAVWLFGTMVESAMDEAERRYDGKKVKPATIQGARMAVLQQLTADPFAGPAATAGAFRDPLASSGTVGRKPRRIIGGRGRKVGQVDGVASDDLDDDEIPAPPWREGADRAPDRPAGWTT